MAARFVLFDSVRVEFTAQIYLLVLLCLCHGVMSITHCCQPYGELMFLTLIRKRF